MGSNAPRMLGTTLLALALAANTAAAATTRRVPEDFATIQAALDASQPGDRVVVGPGVWAGNLDFNAVAITLESTGGAAATTILAPGGTVVTLGPGGALVGFTVSGGSGTFGAGMAVSGGGTRIAQNVFQGNAQAIGGAGAGIFGNGASPLIEGNIFRGQTCDTQYSSGVITFFNNSSPQIVNNVFEDNTCPAINMVLPSGAGPRVINNTFVANSVAVRLYRNVATTSQVYRNNILVGNTTGVLANGGTEVDNPVWQHNLVFGNGADYAGLQSQTGVNGNLSADPKFRSAPQLDYHLAAGSPAIDAGTALGAPAADFDGRARPGDGNGDGVNAFDIGAFEVATAQAGRAIVVSPPTGLYYRTQRVDLVVAIQDPARVVGGAVRIDGQDVTGLFVACAAAGRSAPDSATLRCPGVSVGLLAPGIHTWSVRIDFNDGTSEQQAVQWDVRQNTEP